jgi:methanogenic corrinoid protein MtbC1
VPDQLRQRFLQAQLKGDRREALRLLLDDGVNAGVPIRDLQLKVVQEAQREIGRLWQENLVTIAQEHLATAIANMALSHLYDLAPNAARNGRKAIIACVEGELHEFPARLAADALDLAGFEVRYLGASVPTDSLVAMVRDERPDLLALSATMTFNAPALRTAVARIRREGPPGVHIAVGGGVCQWLTGIAAEVGADISGCDAAELVTAAEHLFGVTHA